MSVRPLRIDYESALMMAIIAMSVLWKSCRTYWNSLLRSNTHERHINVYLHVFGGTLFFRYFAEKRTTYTFFNTYSYVRLPFNLLQQSPLRRKSRGHHTKWAFGGSGHLTWRRSIVIYQTKPRPISWGHQQQPCGSLLILSKASYS